MAFFIHHSWLLIERLEIHVGFWSQQSRIKNYFIRTTYILLIISVLAPVMMRCKHEWGVDFSIVTENISGLMLVVGNMIKCVMTFLYNKERQNIYGKVNDHFRRITDAHEAYLLSKSAEYGNKFSFVHLNFHYATVIIFFCLPVAQMFFVYLTNNGELEKIIPYYVDYGFINVDKYYGLIMLQILLAAIFCSLSNAAYDCAFIMNARHVCALFEIVELRLHEASGFLEEYEWDILDFMTADNTAYEFVTQAIDLHNEAFEMVKSIERIYNFTLIVVILENVFIFNGGVYLVLLNQDQPFNLLRYFTLFIALTIHFFTLFIHGQMIMNSSSSVFDACCNMKWYLASPKTRKLLSIMMSKSSNPSVITGGGLFIISMETLSKMMKAGFSYLSVFTQRISH